MRSIRIDDGLDRRIQAAAARRGESVSAFLRQAAIERVDATMRAERVDFSDVLGVVRGGGGRARRTGEAFADELRRRRSTR